MQEQQPPVYVDSNIFIYPVIYEAEKSPNVSKAKEILRKIERNRIIAYTSTLTWDEVVWVVKRTLGKADSLEIGRKLLRFPNLRLIDVSESIIVKAQLLMEKYDISPRDAVHCASAIVKHIDVLVSEDLDFEVVKEIRRIPMKNF